MLGRDQDLHRVGEAWERFVCGIETDLSLLRPEIVDSWRRCRDSGISPDLDSAPPSLRPVSSLDGDLAHAGSEVVTLLQNELDRDSTSICVSNQDADIVLVSGGPRALDASGPINARPGFSWSEARSGTNVLGTGSLLGKPIQIAGPEHYVAAWHPWFCCSAPILHPAARMVVGSLAISGFREAVHQRTLEIAAGASNLIAKVLYGVQAGDRDALRRAYDTMSQRYHQATLLLVDAYGVVTDAANSTSIASEALRDAVGRCLAEVPGFETFTDLELSRQPQQLSVSIDNVAGVTAEPIFNGERFAGTVVVLSPTRGFAKRLLSSESHEEAANSWSSEHTFSEIVGRTEAIRKAVTSSLKAASTNYPVLLLGESGTGKELFAQSIHKLSSRGCGPFVAFNCGAVSEELIASELFGHEPGAFTGSSRRTKAGLLDAANGGTLFIDELQDAAPKVQSHLLRFLETGTFVRVGGTVPVTTSARIIAASNAQSAELARKVRLDLLYRLNCVTVEIPPLRKRREDIRLIGERLLRDKLQFTGTVDEEVWQKLFEYEWPGNVRELQNVLIRATLNCSGSRLTADDLPQWFGINAGFYRPSRELENLRSVLRESGGDVTEAATRLGIHRSTFYRRLARVGGLKQN